MLAWRNKKILLDTAHIYSYAISAHRIIAHYRMSKDSDETAWICRIIWICTLHTCLKTDFTWHINSFSSSGEFCRLLITFANSLDPDLAWQNIGPDLDSNCLTLWLYFWKIVLKKLILKKNTQTTKKHAKLPSKQRVKVYCFVFKTIWKCFVICVTSFGRLPISLRYHSFSVLWSISTISFGYILSSMHPHWKSFSFSVWHHLEVICFSLWYHSVSVLWSISTISFGYILSYMYPQWKSFIFSVWHHLSSIFSLWYHSVSVFVK